MPRKKRNGLFDFLKPRTTVYHVRPRRSAKAKSASHLSASIRKLGPSHKIVKVGDHYEVPSLDRGSWFDTREDAQRFIREMKKYNPKRKRNLEIGLPSNQFVNAKVRMKGGKIQVMADESVLGKAGFKAGAGLSGVSVSGGAKLNPKRALSVPEKHQLAIARKTLKMPDAMVGVMGGPSKAQAREIIKRLTGKSANPSYRKTKKHAKKAQRAGLLEAGPMFQKWRKAKRVSKTGRKRK